MGSTARSLEITLNRIIDDEMKKKDELDDELVIACCDGLLEMEDIERYSISEKQLENRIDEIVSGQTTKRKIRLRKTAKILLAAAIIITLLAGTAFGIISYKDSIIKYWDHSTVFFNSSDKKINGELTVGYIPEGFEMTETDEGESVHSKSYTKNESFFNVVVQSRVKEYDIDTEYADARRVTIDNLDYIIFGETQNGIGIVWQEDGYVYSVTSSNIEESDLLKIAQSVSLK